MKKILFLLLLAPCLLTAQDIDKYKIKPHWSDTSHVTVKILRDNGQIDFLTYGKYLQERVKNAYLKATLYFYDGVNVKEVKLMDSLPMPIGVPSPHGWHIDIHRENQRLISDSIILESAKRIIGQLPPP